MKITDKYPEFDRFDYGDKVKILIGNLPYPEFFGIVRNVVKLKQNEYNVYLDVYDKNGKLHLQNKEVLFDYLTKINETKKEYFYESLMSHEQEDEGYWVDPAGGVHPPSEEGDDYDPAEMYAEKGKKISRAQKEYNKEVDNYKWYVVNKITKHVETGYEFKQDAIDQKNDMQFPDMFAVISKKDLTKHGFEIPNEKWKSLERGSKIKKYVNGKKLSSLELTIFTSSQKKTEYLEKLLKSPGFENVKYSKVKNQLGGDIFTMTNWQNETQIYSFGFEWSGIIRHHQLGEHGMKIAYANGKKIVDFTKLSIEELRADYPLKNAEWVWDNWTNKQKFSFVEDHFKNYDIKKIDLTVEKKYNQLFEDVTAELKKHINEGRYETGKGDESKKNYEIMVHDLRNMPSVSKINIKPYGVEIIPYSSESEAYVPPIKLTTFELISLTITSLKENKTDSYDDAVKSLIEGATEHLLRTNED